MTNEGNLSQFFEDPTLLAVDAALMERTNSQPKRAYLGASLLGHPCERHIFYAIQPDVPREPLSATSIKAIQDGFRTEDLVIQRLRMVPGVRVWNRDEQGQQYKFSDMDGMFAGHIDGVVEGLHQAPKTPHILEVKCCNEKKFKAFQDARAKYPEKDVLENWDTQFHVQAILYMEYFDLTRHYLVVATPGGRQMSSCRTEAKPKFAAALREKARRIINSKTEPSRISNDSAFFRCRWCEFSAICHNK